MRSEELLGLKDRRTGSHIETEKDRGWGHEWCLEAMVQENLSKEEC